VVIERSKIVQKSICVGARPSTPLGEVRARPAGGEGDSQSSPRTPPRLGLSGLGSPFGKLTLENAGAHGPVQVVNVTDACIGPMYQTRRRWLLRRMATLSCHVTLKLNRKWTTATRVNAWLRRRTTTSTRSRSSNTGVGRRPMSTALS